MRGAWLGVAELVAQAAAITLVFVRGSIFERLRSAGPALWRELASCAMCAGFWVGAIWCVVSAGYEPLRCFATGALTAAAALLLVRVLDALEIAGE